MSEAALKTNKKRVVEIGDPIQFTRKGISIRGEVTGVRENTVLVSIPKEVADHLGYETNYTVVSHKNFLIV